MRWRKLLIGLAVIAALIAIVIALIPREPKYDGRTLSEWIKDSAPRKSPDPEQTKAIEAVRHIGTNGLPWLVKWIGAKEPADWQLKLTTANSRLPRWIRLRLLPSLFGVNSYYAHRRTALDGFLILGPDAKRAVPDLLQIIATSPGVIPAGAALDSIGANAALPAALDILTNQVNPLALRVAAAVWISHTDSNLEKATILSLLVRCVRENHPMLRPVAVRLLAGYGVQPDLVVPILISQLRASSPELRGDAVYSLRPYAHTVPSVVPALVGALHDSHPIVRAIAVDVLFQIDPDALEKAAPAEAEKKRQWRRIVDGLPQRSDK